MAISASAVVRAAGFRATKPRIAVYAALQRAQSPLSVDEISKLTGRASIDRVTLYRILQAFERAGLARSVDFRKGFVLYELQDAHDHHHLVCTGCGTVEDFDGCNIESLAARALRTSKTFSSVTNHSLELFGTCTSCVNKK